MGRDAYWKALTIMDAKLADQPYIMGKYSLADTYPLVFYNWGLIGDYPVADLANLAAFKDRMIARPAVRRVLEREGCPLIA
jgi:glutathione S-transferase